MASFKRESQLPRRPKESILLPDKSRVAVSYYDACDFAPIPRSIIAAIWESKDEKTQLEIFNAAFVYSYTGSKPKVSAEAQTLFDAMIPNLSKARSKAKAAKIKAAREEEAEMHGAPVQDDDTAVDESSGEVQEQTQIEPTVADPAPTAPPSPSEPAPVATPPQSPMPTSPASPTERAIYYSISRGCRCYVDTDEPIEDEIPF